jgi:hypothetical protein
MSIKYDFLTDEDKKTIVENELKKLEAQHFGMKMIEPSKLQQQTEHLQWQQAITTIENNINKIKKKKSELGV